MAQVKAIVGWFLALLGTVMGGVWLDRVLAGQNRDPAMSVVLTGLFLAGGVQLIRSAKRDRERAALTDPRTRPASREHVVLHAAREAGGTVTAVLVAERTALSFDEVQAELDQLARKGACDVDASDSGAVVYRFAGLGLLPPK
ncbi:MAG: hypothetical protein HY902_20605 [Deltaproteobacteria bacterium]|nr:hypothetical protein [Deltaproteobacteria bacterium]